MLPRSVAANRVPFISCRRLNALMWAASPQEARAIKGPRSQTDKLGMFISSTGVTVLVLTLALVVGTLYIMRRRVRQGRRKPTF